MKNMLTSRTSSYILLEQIWSSELHRRQKINVDYLCQELEIKPCELGSRIRDVEAHTKQISKSNTFIIVFDCIVWFTLTLNFWYLIFDIFLISKNKPYNQIQSNTMAHNKCKIATNQLFWENMKAIQENSGNYICSTLQYCSQLKVR